MIWDVKVPPKIEMFLWLFSQNKILTKDNLRRRGIPKPLECSLCKEIESVHHLFFDYIVARNTRDLVTKVFSLEITDFESLASK